MNICDVKSSLLFWSDFSCIYTLIKVIIETIVAQVNGAVYGSLFSFFFFVNSMQNLRFNIKIVLMLLDFFCTFCIYYMVSLEINVTIGKCVPLKIHVHLTHSMLSTGYKKTYWTSSFHPYKPTGNNFNLS